jgi:RNA recognition motif-containing protein
MAQGRNGDGRGGCAVFVGNLAFQTTWGTLKDVFRQAGAVRFCDVLMDASGRSKGSAVVTFEDEAGASNAIATLNETEVDGRRIRLRLFEDHAPPRAARRDERGAPTGSGTKVFVSNLPFSYSDADLWQLFAAEGAAVVSAHVLSDRATGRPRGMGVVEFGSPADAQYAIEKGNGASVGGRALYVRYDREAQR